MIFRFIKLLIGIIKATYRFAYASRILILLNVSDKTNDTEK